MGWMKCNYCAYHFWHFFGSHSWISSLGWLEPGLQSEWDGSGELDQVSGPKLFLLKLLRSMFNDTWSLLVPICIDIFLDLIFVSRVMVRHFRVRGRKWSQSKISLKCSAPLKTISVIVVASRSRVLFGSFSLSTSKGDNPRSPSPSSASGQFANLLIKQNKFTKCQERNHFSYYFPYLTQKYNYPLSKFKFLSFIELRWA